MNKKVLYAVGGVCLIAAGLFGAKVWYEGKLRGDIETALASLPAPLTAKAERVEVSILHRSFTFINLTGEYADPSGTITYSVNRLKADGVALEAFKPDAGIMKLADAVDFSGIRVSGPVLSGTIESYSLRGISGDYTKILKATAAVLPEIAKVYSDPDYATDPEQSAALLGRLSRLMEAYETVTIAGVEAKNYAYTAVAGDKKIECSIDQADVTGYSVRHMGPTAIHGISLSEDGNRVAHIGRIAMDGATIPSLVKLLDDMGAKSLPPSLILEEALRGQEFSIRNLRMEKIAVYFPNNPKSLLFSLNDSTINFTNDGGYAYDMAWDGLNVPLALLEEDGWPAQALSRLTDPLSLAGKIDLRITAKAQNLNDLVFSAESRSASLGGFALDFSVTDVASAALMMGSLGNMRLGKFNITLNDKGASDVLCAIAAAGTEKTPEEVRAEAIQEVVLEQETLPNETLKAFVGTIIAFIKEPGGTLRLSLVPSEPLTVPEMRAASVMLPEKLGLSAVFTPPE